MSHQPEVKAWLAELIEFLKTCEDEEGSVEVHLDDGVYHINVEIAKYLPRKLDG